MNKGLLSIIVVIYNEENYIRECINSIISQTYKNTEIILINDGSIDNSGKLCDEFAKKDSRIKVIHKSNGGLVAARKTGLLNSTGEFIAYVDGDDFIEPEMYKSMINTLIKDNSDMVISGYKKHLCNKTIECTNNILPGVYSGNILKEKVFSSMIYTGDFFKCGLYTYLWNKLFRRDIIFRHQFNVDDRIMIGEDFSCVYPAILDANTISINNDTYYHYRIRKNSILRNTNNKNNNIGKLYILNRYIDNLFSKSKYSDLLNNQFLFYKLSNLLMFSEEIISFYPKIESTFPFINIENKKQKIIIYSCGSFGIHIFNQYSNCTNLEITAWVDPNYSCYNHDEFNIQDLDSAILQEFDYIVIASIDSDFVKKSKQLIIDKKVHRNKIISIDQSLEQDILILKEIGLI